MTIFSLLATLLRRWYVVVAVLVLTGLIMVHIEQKPSLYWSQVDVVFLIPKSSRYPNSIAVSSSSVVAMAGVVAADVNQGKALPRTASAGASLAGQGIRDGWSVRLPDTGGQWAQDFSRPVLDVQVVGPDPETVQNQLEHQVQRIVRALKLRQSEQGTRSQDFITASSAPAQAVIHEERGRRTQALAIVMLLGIWMAALSAVAVDSYLAARRRRRHRTPLASAFDADLSDT